MPLLRTGTAEIMLLLVALIWGTSYGVAKSTLVFYPVLGFLAIRFLCTFVLLLPQVWRHWHAVWRPGLPLGLMLLAIFLCETFGVAHTTASNAAFLISLCVVFTPLAEWLWLGVRPNRALVLAILLALACVWLLQGGQLGTLNGGDWLMLAAAVIRALAVCLTRRLQCQQPLPALALTGLQAGVVGFACLGLFLLLAQPMPPLPASPAFWFGTLYLVLFCTLFAFFAQNRALRHTSATRAALLMGSEPVFGALFAAVWLGEQLGWLSWLGGGLIVLAAWLALRR